MLQYSQSNTINLDDEDSTEIYSESSENNTINTD